MVAFTHALVLAFIHATVALPSSSSLDGMSLPTKNDGCCLLSPDSDVVYESTCKMLSSYKGVDSYSCPDIGMVEYKFNAKDPVHSEIRVSPNVGLQKGLYVHGWCIDDAQGTTDQTSVAYCPSSVEGIEPSTRPFLKNFAGCKNADFKVVSYLGKQKCSV